MNDHQPPVDNRKEAPNRFCDPVMQHETNDIYLDVNGCLTERVVLDGQEVIVHYDNIPQSDD